MARYYMMNKPAGYITARRDERRATVMDLLPEELSDLHPIGRLDADTRGLLLFTDDGRADHALLHPTHHVEKTYRLCAVGEITAEKCAALERGVSLPGDEKITLPAKIQVEKVCVLSDLADELPLFRRRRRLKKADKPAFCARLTLREGRKHQVKRMMLSVGCRVFSLTRLSIGGITLDERLPAGGWRPLSAHEVEVIESHIRAVGEQEEAGEQREREEREERVLS